MNRYLCVSLLSLIAACGSDVEKISVDARPLCAVYQQVCERQAECGVFVLSSATDYEQCMESMSCDVIAAGAARRGIEIRADKATECIAELESASCAELVPWVDGEPKQIWNTSDACSGVLQGTRGEGQECLQTQECGPGLQCSGDTCPGVCEPIGAGDCTPGSCGDGEFCGWFECEQRARLGEACEFSEHENSCEDGSHCVLDWDTDEAKCKPQFAADSACVLEDSGPFACKDGQFCSDESKCTPPLASGADCYMALQCGADGYCDFDGGSKCRPAKSAGVACDGTIDRECGILDCIDGVCGSYGATPDSDLTTEVRPFVGEGQDCSSANCEAGLVCWPEVNSESWTCRPKFAPGQSCEPVEELKIWVFLSPFSVTSCSDGAVCNILSEHWSCVVPQEAGESCSSEGPTLECQSGACVSGSCTEPFPEECPL